MSVFPTILTDVAAIDAIRDVVHSHGIRGAVSFMMTCAEVPVSDEAVGRQIYILAGQSMVKYQTEEKLGDVLRTDQEVYDAIGGFALLELLDALKRVEKETLS